MKTVNHSFCLMSITSGGGGPEKDYNTYLEQFLLFNISSSDRAQKTRFAAETIVPYQLTLNVMD